MTPHTPSSAALEDGSATTAQPGGSAAIPPAVRAFLAREQKLLIGGEWVAAADGGTMPTYDPQPALSLRRSPQAARRTSTARWRPLGARSKIRRGARWRPSERGRLVWRLADLIEQHAEEFAVLESLDNGKPIAEARAADLPLAVDFFRYYAGLGDKIEGKTIPIESPTRRSASSATRGASRSASSGRSSRGTSRC